MHQLTHEEYSKDHSTLNVVVIAENIHTPENVGSLFRIGEAMGVEKIYLTGVTADLSNRKVKKTSRDTHRRIPSEKQPDSLSIISRLKKAGYVIIGLEITDQSVDLRKMTIQKDQKYALVIGSERNGIQKDTLELIDLSIHIPMFGTNSSMNVATALGIGLWEFVRQVNTLD